MTEFDFEPLDIAACYGTGFTAHLPRSAIKALQALPFKTCN